MAEQGRRKQPSVQDEGRHLRGRTVELRLVTPGDTPALADLLAQPSVRAWWGAYDEERLREDVFELPEEGASFAIVMEGAVVGLIQCWEENTPDYRHASMDIAVRHERAGHPRLQPSRIQARGHHAAVRTGRGRDVARRAAHGPAGGGDDRRVTSHRRSARGWQRAVHQG